MPQNKIPKQAAQKQALNEILERINTANVNKSLRFWWGYGSDYAGLKNLASSNNIQRFIKLGGKSRNSRLNIPSALIHAVKGLKGADEKIKEAAIMKLKALKQTSGVSVDVLAESFFSTVPKTHNTLAQLMEKETVKSAGLNEQALRSLIIFDRNKQKNAFIRMGFDSDKIKFMSTFIDEAHFESEAVEDYPLTSLNVQLMLLLYANSKEGEGREKLAKSLEAQFKKVRVSSESKVINNGKTPLAIFEYHKTKLEHKGKSSAILAMLLKAPEQVARDFTPFTGKSSYSHKLFATPIVPLNSYFAHSAPMQEALRDLIILKHLDEKTGELTIEKKATYPPTKEKECKHRLATLIEEDDYHTVTAAEMLQAILRDCEYALLAKKPDIDKLENAKDHLDKIELIFNHALNAEDSELLKGIKASINMVFPDYYLNSFSD